MKSIAFLSLIAVIMPAFASATVVESPCRPADLKKIQKVLTSKKTEIQDQDREIAELVVSILREESATASCVSVEDLNLAGFEGDSLTYIVQNDDGTFKIKINEDKINNTTKAYLERE